MQLEEFMTQHGIAKWDTQRISRRGNLVLTAGRTVHIQHSDSGVVQTYFHGVVVNPRTHTIVDCDIQFDSWMY